MKENLILNFFPTYGYKIYKFSAVILLIVIGYFILSMLTGVAYTSMDMIIWIMAVLLFVMTFSKNSRNDIPFAKNYVGKIVVFLIVSTILGLSLTEFITKKIVSLNYLYLVFIGLISYHILLNIVILISNKKEIIIEDIAFPENIQKNKTLSIVLIISSIITLLLLLFI